MSSEYDFDDFDFNGSETSVRSPNQPNGNQRSPDRSAPTLNLDIRPASQHEFNPQPSPNARVQNQDSTPDNHEYRDLGHRLNSQYLSNNSGQSTPRHNNVVNPTPTQLRSRSGDTTSPVQQPQHTTIDNFDYDYDEFDHAEPDPSAVLGRAQSQSQTSRQTTQPVQPASIDEVGNDGVVEPGVSVSQSTTALTPTTHNTPDKTKVTAVPEDSPPRVGGVGHISVSDAAATTPIQQRVNQPFTKLSPFLPQQSEPLKQPRQDNRHHSPPQQHQQQPIQPQQQQLVQPQQQQPVQLQQQQQQQQQIQPQQQQQQPQRQPQPQQRQQHPQHPVQQGPPTPTPVTPPHTLTHTMPRIPPPTQPPSILVDGLTLRSSGHTLPPLARCPVRPAEVAQVHHLVHNKGVSHKFTVAMLGRFQQVVEHALRMEAVEVETRRIVERMDAQVCEERETLNAQIRSLQRELENTNKEYHAMAAEFRAVYTTAELKFQELSEQRPQVSPEELDNIRSHIRLQLEAEYRELAVQNDQKAVQFRDLWSVARNEVDTLRMQMEALQLNTETALEMERRTASSKISQLSDLNQELQKKIKDVSSDTRVRELTHECSSLRSKCDHLDRLNHTLKIHNVELGSALETVRNDCDYQLAQLDMQLSTTVKVAEATGAKADRLTNDLEMNKTLMLAKEKRVVELTREVSCLKADLANMYASQASELQRTQDQQQRTHAAEQHKYKLLETANTDLVFKNMQLESECAMLRTQSESNARETTTKAHAQQLQIAELTDRFENKIATLQLELSEARQQLRTGETHHHAELTSLRQRLDSLSHTKAATPNVDTELMMLRTELTRKDQRLLDMSSALKAKEMEHAVLLQDADVSKRIIADMKEYAEKREQEDRDAMARVRGEREEMMLRCRQLETQLHSVSEEMNQEVARLSALVTQTQIQHNAEVDTLKTQYNECLFGKEKYKAALTKQIHLTNDLYNTNEAQLKELWVYKSYVEEHDRMNARSSSDERFVMRQSNRCAVRDTPQ